LILFVLWYLVQYLQARKTSKVRSGHHRKRTYCKRLPMQKNGPRKLLLQCVMMLPHVIQSVHAEKFTHCSMTPWSLLGEQDSVLVRFLALWPLRADCSVQHSRLQLAETGFVASRRIWLLALPDTLCGSSSKLNGFLSSLVLPRFLCVEGLVALLALK